MVRWRHGAWVLLPLMLVGGLPSTARATPAGTGELTAMAPGDLTAAVPGARKGPPRARPCPTTKAARLLAIRITSPRAGAKIDLADTPEFAVTGVFRGRLAGLVRRVELSSDGAGAGDATIARRTGGNGDRSWRTALTLPPGRHTLRACVRIWGDTSAAARVVVTVKKPARSETVLSPDVVTPPDKVLGDITGTTPTTLEFRDDPGLGTGDIIRAGVTPTTPAGLLRRVTGVRREGAATIVSTRPAALDEAFLQLHVKVVDQPLIPAGSRIAGRRAADKVVTVPAIDAEVSLEADHATNGAHGSGDLRMTATGNAKLYATLTVGIDIDFNLLDPLHPKLKHVLWQAESTAELSASATWTASGELSYRKADAVPPQPLGVVMAGEIPIVVTAGLDAGADADLTASLTLGAQARANAATGFEYRNGKTALIDQGSVTASGIHPFNGGAKASGSATVWVEPRLNAAVFGLAGPSVRPEMGVTGRFEAPCPGRVQAGPYLTPRVSADLTLFGKTVAELPAQTGAYHAWLVDRPFFGCGPDDLAIGSEPLPDAMAGTLYSAALQASGGTGPYSWKVLGGLPPGLELTGSALTGRPGKAGTYDVAVEVTDDDGHRTSGTVPVKVVPDGAPQLAVTTSRLPDGFVGIAYATKLAAGAGTAPYRWTGSLPGGLSLAEDGTISGSPAAAGTTTVTLTVTDAAGATATATTKLTVNDRLPAPVTPVRIPAPVGPTCGPICTVSWGDPHLRTFDGRTYDFQQVGEFVAARSATSDLEVQVRQRPWGGSRVVAVNSAVAARINGHRVGVYLTDAAPRILVDGEETTGELPGGGTASVDPSIRRVTISGPDGTYLGIDYDPGSALHLSLGVADEQRGQLQGLLGDADGDATDDLADAGGTVVDPAQLYTGFADAWRVTPATALFDYPDGEDTATYTDRAFPYADLPLTAVPEANRKAAREACAVAGLTDETTLDACALDVALSGDAGQAVAAVKAQAAGDVQSGAVLASSRPGTPWRDETGAEGVSELSYGHAGCAGVDGQTCTGGAWPKLPGAAWIWTQRLTSAGHSRATFTATVSVTAAQAAKPARLSAAGDNKVTARLNGDEVLSATFADPVSSTIVHLRPGANTLTFDVVNEPGDNALGNPAGLLWKLAAEG